MAHDRFQSAGGLRLHYIDYGGESNPPLVCIHGLTRNAHDFDALAPHLVSRYHVLAIDVRGRGDSEWGPPLDYNATVYVSDLVAFLDGLKMPRATLIGTSMGGIIAMMFAGGYPERAERVVMNDIGPDIDPQGLGRIMAALTEAPNRFTSFAEVAAYYRASYPPAAVMPEGALIEWVKTSVKPVDGGFTWKMDPAIRNPPRTGPAARPVDLWLPFTRIIAPIMVVRGGDSDVLSLETADRMLKVNRGTTMVEVPGVGHAPSLVEPESLSALRRFLGVAG